MSDPILTTTDNIKIGTGLTSVVLAHGACLLAGAYKGLMNAVDVEVDIPFRYLWGSNIIGTGIGNALAREEESTSKRTAMGAALGIVAAPIEYISGYMAGYLTGFISENVFS